MIAVAKKLMARDVTDEQASAADSLRLQPIDQARGVARPDGFAQTYGEAEYDAYADEQSPLWDAEGTGAARDTVMEAGGAKPAAEEALRQLLGQQQLIETTRDRYQLCLQALSPFQRREPGAKKWYLARWGLLLGGDVAGQAGAALSYGEPYVTAIPQALATGAAAITAGMVGADVRDRRMAALRRKDPNDLPDDLKLWAHLFSGSDSGTALVKTVMGVATVAALLVAGGIFALRASVEGSLGGIVYGCLAGAITLASFINAYFYADEIADQIDSAQARYNNETARANRLANGDALRRFNQSTAAADSITHEYAKRGEAAAVRFRALKWRAMRGNPGVVGHGFAPEPEPPIGRRTRQENHS